MPWLEYQYSLLHIEHTHIQRGGGDVKKMSQHLGSYKSLHVWLVPVCWCSRHCWCGCGGRVWRGRSGRWVTRHSCWTTVTAPWDWAGPPRGPVAAYCQPGREHDVIYKGWKQLNRNFALKYFFPVQTSNLLHQKKSQIICKQLAQLLIWKTHTCIHNHELKNHGIAIMAQLIILLLHPMFKHVYHCFQKRFVHKSYWDAWSNDLTRIDK